MVLEQISDHSVFGWSQAASEDRAPGREGMLLVLVDVHP